MDPVDFADVIQRHETQGATVKLSTFLWRLAFPVSSRGNNRELPRRTPRAIQELSLPRASIQLSGPPILGAAIWLFDRAAV